jgi:hypothetical protein
MPRRPLAIPLGAGGRHLWNFKEVGLRHVSGSMALMTPPPILPPSLLFLCVCGPPTVGLPHGSWRSYHAAYTVPFPQ